MQRVLLRVGWRTGALTACFALASCMTVVHYDYDLQARLQESDGMSPSKKSTALVVRSREGEDGRSWTVETPSWRMRVGPTAGAAFGARIENLDHIELCIDLPRSRVAVGGRPLVPLPVTGLKIANIEQRQLRMLGQPLSSGPRIEVPVVCVPPQGNLWLAVYLDVPSLAGRAFLFEPIDSRAATASREDNRVTFEISLVSGSSSSMLRLQMTAERSLARRVYY